VWAWTTEMVLIKSTLLFYETSMYVNLHHN